MNSSKATAPKFKETLERFVGGLLMAKADEGTGRLYLSMDKNRFKDYLIPVSYRNFDAAVKALSAEPSRGHAGPGALQASPVGQGRHTEMAGQGVGYTLLCHQCAC